ncbi:MAG TPA: sugar phosphate nucleotidyltransferase [Pyrinomonadaceae bacterium]|nr:sugar phosphate nucleotidyltransferase [Pyrinomonadaceae bacterium]
MIRTALIMAAGRGARMAPLTDDIPKPMAPFGGTTLIARGIDRLRNHVDHIYITVGYKKAMLAQHVIEHGATAVFNTEGRGNAWWIYNTLVSGLDEPVCVLTADNLVELDLDLMFADYRKLNEPPCMLVPVRPVPGLEGDFIFRDGSCVTHLSRTQPHDIYCSGIQVVNPKRLNEVTDRTEDFNDVWAQLISQKLLHVSSVYPRKWISVDTMEQLARLDVSQ